MFRYKQLQEGKHRLVHFFDGQNKNEFTLCLNKGGTWTRLILNGTSIIDGYQTEEELDELPAAKNVLLLPFVNRLKDGRLNWQGNVYEWPINDVSYQHAIHGFGMHLPMQLSIQSLSPLVFDLYCYYPGLYRYYPFTFEFRVTYQLNFDSDLTVTMQVKNCDKVTFPFAMGFHPYFQISELIDKCHISIPQVEKLCVDTRMIPTDKVVQIPEKKFMSLLHKNYDDCFRLPSPDKMACVRLYDDTRELMLWQQIGHCGMNYLQIYTPPHRRSIAIEPMTSAIDGLNTLQGDWVIQPEESRQVQWGIVLKDRV